MLKAYIVGYKSRESANHQIVDYWFSMSAKDAMKIPTREWAQMEAARFNFGITINEDIQRPHLLDDFKVEEFEDGYVVACEGPFIVRARGEGAAQNTAENKADPPSAPLIATAQAHS